MNEKLINEILEYVERNVEADDRESWSGRDFKQILKDGDTALIPSFYFELIKMVN